MASRSQDTTVETPLVSRGPLLEGAVVEVYRIAALLGGGASAKELLEDDPSLPRQQVETAKAYANTCSKAGRPEASARRGAKMLVHGGTGRKQHSGGVDCHGDSKLSAVVTGR